LFGIGARPVNPDDVPSAGVCHRPTRPEANQPPAPQPIDIALDVAFGLPWPNPVPHTAPAWQSGSSLTGMPTWLWVDGVEPISGQSSGAGVVVQVTARPVATVWDLREGRVRCDGLGEPYERGGSTDCTYTFTETSDHQRGGRFHASVLVTWQVAWTASNGASGTFGRAVTGAPFTIDVDEAQAVTD
jgi:hypothetical protein